MSTLNISKQFKELAFIAGLAAFALIAIKGEAPHEARPHNDIYQPSDNKNSSAKPTYTP